MNEQPEVNSQAAPTTVSTDPARGTGWKVGVGAVVIGALLAGGFVLRHGQRGREATALKQTAAESSEAPAAVEVIQVHRAGARKVLSLPGEARALNETTLFARTSGYISKWLVDIGDPVKAGQTLAVIETPELDDQLAAARAKVAAAESNQKLAEAGATFAKLTYERWDQAAPEGVVSAQERDQKKSELDTSNAKVAASEAEVKLAQAEVQRLQTLASFKNVTAPFDGTITQRHIDIGDLVTAGSTSNTSPLFSVARFDKLRVFVEVPQGAIGEVRKGMTAAVSEQGGPTLTGTVDRSSGAIDRQSRTMRVEVMVDNPGEELKPGGYVQVTFQTQRAEPPVEIPAAALVFRTGGPEAVVVAADGTVEFKKIVIGRDLGDRIEVASGLDDGDRVALNISSDVADGQKIEVHESTRPALADQTPTPPSGAPKAQKPKLPRPEVQSAPELKAVKTASALRN